MISPLATEAPHSVTDVWVRRRMSHARNTIFPRYSFDLHATQGKQMFAVKNQCLGLLDRITTLADSAAIELPENHSLAEEMQRAELLVPIIGAFSAGKSSLINTFLGADILPVGITPETELATELRFSRDPHVLAHRADGGSDRLAVEDLLSIKPRASSYTHLELHLDDPRLEALYPQVLVDMPGFGSSLDSHNKAIAHYLPRGAHFIVAVSVPDGTLAESTLRQLETMQTYEAGFSILLSKANLRSAEEVDAVEVAVREQLELRLGVAPAMARDDRKQGNGLASLLPKISASDLWIGRFLPRISRQLAHARAQVKMARKALDQSDADIDRSVRQLNDALDDLNAQRDALVAKLGRSRLSQVVEQCVEEVGQALREASSELQAAAAGGNNPRFAQVVSDISRQRLSRVVKERMEGLSQQAIGDLAKSLSQREVDEVGSVGGPDWTQQMQTRVQETLTQTGQALERWQGNLQKAREDEKLLRPYAGDDENDREKTQRARVAFRSITTVLAVTTSVVAPAIELVVIFLPEILGFVSRKLREEELRKTIDNQVIPSVQREFRTKLPELLQAQVDGLIEQAVHEFKTAIEEKRQLLESVVAEQSSPARAARVKALDAAEAGLTSVANEVVALESAR
ncbi:dynamin family protein [Stenotrophomonas maltophilia]|uniref:dynamin family protein n=3 Tax=Lysobacteraceae TaxID=32033 RepID=UPI0013109518|nr:dynamin family protein [Stenotrophomonas maltophilia]